MAQQFDLAPAIAEFIFGLPFNPDAGDFAVEVQRKVDLIRAQFPLASLADIERGFDIVTALAGSQAAYLHSLNVRKAEILAKPGKARPGELQKIDADIRAALAG